MKKFFACLIILILSLTSVPAFAQLSEVSVGPSQTQEIDRHGICKVVKNLNTTNALYVPSMARDEWVNFLSVPPWREVSECVRCAGYARDGYCFYAGAATADAGVGYATCNSVCASHGGIDAAGMNRLISRSIVTASSTPVPQAEGLWGGSVQLAGGGYGGGTYYCAIIARALIGSAADDEVVFGSQGTYGCASITYNKNQAFGQISIDSGWTGAGTPVLYCARSQAICACNR